MDKDTKKQNLIVISVVGGLLLTVAIIVGVKISRTSAKVDDTIDAATEKLDAATEKVSEMSAQDISRKTGKLWGDIKRGFVEGAEDTNATESAAIQTAGE